MLTIEGIYKNGQIILTETPVEVNESKVLITFLDTKEINLQKRGIDKSQASELRAKLSPMAEDWNLPEMDVTILIKRGDVVRALFPNSNLRTAKRRPALVVQADNLQTGLSQTILAMISSNLNRANHHFA